MQRLCAQYGLKLADAIQAAVALQAKSEVLLTNDTDLKKVTEVRVLLVSEWNCNEQGGTSRCP